ncbi:hypothetical protein DFH06DRAFT_1415419 [Mycena polygramma]|nr:hypothetical protein DFH06DRAFT_1415419 [Mycena polygramma]
MRRNRARAWKSGGRSPSPENKLPRHMLLFAPSSFVLFRSNFGLEARTPENLIRNSTVTVTNNTETKQRRAGRGEGRDLDPGGMTFLITGADLNDHRAGADGGEGQWKGESEGGEEDGGERKEEVGEGKGEQGGSEKGREREFLTDTIFGNSASENTRRDSFTRAETGDGKKGGAEVNQHQHREHQNRRRCELVAIFLLLTESHDFSRKFGDNLPSDGKQARRKQFSNSAARVLQSRISTWSLENLDDGGIYAHLAYLGTRRVSGNNIGDGDGDGARWR